MPNLSSHAPLELPASIRSRMFGKCGIQAVGGAIDADNSAMVYAAKKDDIIAILRRTSHAGKYTVTVLKNIDPEGKIPPPLNCFQFMPQQATCFDHEGNTLSTESYQYDNHPLATRERTSGGNTISETPTVIEIIHQYHFDIMDAKRYSEHNVASAPPR